MPTTRPAWIDELFAAIDDADAERFVSFLTPDAEFRLGTMPPVVGTRDVQAAVAGFWGSLESSSHTLEEVWGDAAGERMLVRGRVAYVRRDGSELVVPFANVFHLAPAGGGEPLRISRYLVYGDFSEL